MPARFHWFAGHGTGGIRFAQMAWKGDKDHLVFQPLGFMNGNDLDQVPLALQVQLLIIGVLIRSDDLFGKPASQGGCSLLFKTGGRQQLAKVQQVGQTPFPILE